MIANEEIKFGLFPEIFENIINISTVNVDIILLQLILE